MTPVLDYQFAMIGHVTPPEDMMAAARVELSEEGFARLMQITGGNPPTPRQLCREVEFEREGRYPPEEDLPPPVSEKILRARREAALIAAAKIELSPAGFRKLMDSIDWRAPTPQEICAAVEAERAARGTTNSSPPD